MPILLGAMNHPDRDPMNEVLAIVREGFDYCDFTIEPPKANITGTMAMEIKQMVTKLKDLTDFGFVGHTAYYLQIAIEFPMVLNTSIQIFRQSIDVLSNMGIKKATIHFDNILPFTSCKVRIISHIYALMQLLKFFPPKKTGIILLLENSPFGANQAAEFKEILAAVPDIGLHLDIAHALVTGGMREVEAFLELGQNGRLKHVHISDNNGQKDEHLPVGVPHKKPHDWPQIIKLLKASGYGTSDDNNTITLEVFSDDHFNRVHSRDLIREMWENA